MSLTTALQKAEAERVSARTSSQLRRDFTRHALRASEYIERIATPSTTERRSLRDLQTLYTYHAEQASLAARLLHGRGEIV